MEAMKARVPIGSSVKYVHVKVASSLPGGKQPFCLEIPRYAVSIFYEEMCFCFKYRNEKNKKKIIILSSEDSIGVCL